jgi:hypothetical protein
MVKICTRLKYLVAFEKLEAVAPYRSDRESALKNSDLAEDLSQKKMGRGDLSQRKLSERPMPISNPEKHKNY